MRKLKYILASIVLAAGFASCETEPIDEKVMDEATPGKAILSFDLNAKQSVVTDNATFNTTLNSMNIVAKLSILNTEDTSNPHTRYKPAYLTIIFNTISVGYFPTILDVSNPNNFTSRARLVVQEFDEEGKEIWVEFSTSNAEENQNAGFANITYNNEVAKYANGNFDYILYPEEDSPYQPQRITNGTFNYINY